MAEISVCIPVYRTEKYLKSCLESIAAQSFTDYEIIIVNDGSPVSCKNGLNVRKIVKEFEKKFGLNVNYIEHSKNLGVLEARRRAVEEAGSTYIMNLDSDDTVPVDALEKLYNMAEKYNADITHGITKTYFSDIADEQIVESLNDIEKRRNNVQKIVGKIYPGILENRDIFEGYLMKQNHCGYLCGKLIRRDTYIEAFSHIPSMFCTMADDVVQYFWISYLAKKYVSLNQEVYRYNINTGISSHRIIKDMVTWSHVCSAASVFSALYNEINNSDIEITEQEAEKLNGLCYFYVENNLKQWKKVVSEDIKEDAYNLLCDYWGSSIIQQAVQNLKSNGTVL